MIKIIQGNILDNNEEYVVLQFDCISTEEKGMYKEFVDEYPFACVYKNRKQMKGFRNQAVLTDRPLPGNIQVFNGETDDDPNVIAIFSQLCPGKSFSGINSKKRFKDDTTENRIKWFTNCLQKISELDIESIAFPWKIGCLDGGENWELYSDILQQFADDNPNCSIYIYLDPWNN